MNRFPNIDVILIWQASMIFLGIFRVSFLNYFVNLRLPSSMRPPGKWFMLSLDMKEADSAFGVSIVRLSGAIIWFGLWSAFMIVGFCFVYGASGTFTIPLDDRGKFILSIGILIVLAIITSLKVGRLKTF